MRATTALILLLIVFLLQSTVLNHLTLLGVKPDLILLVTTFWAFLRGPREGVLVGMTGGVLLDLWRGRWLGLSTLCQMTVAYVIGKVGDRFFKDNLLVPFVIVTGATLLDGLLFLLLGNSFGLNYSLLPVLVRKVLPVLLYNLLVTPLVYSIFWRVHRGLNRWILARGGGVI